jgi:hypothetical protein
LEKKMAESFDMSGAFRFDLAQGKVSLTAAGAIEPAHVVLPGASLLSLTRSLSSDQLVDFGHSVGIIFGARVLQRLDNASAAPPKDLLDHLGGEFALAGLGTLALESWGKALVFTLLDCPVSLSKGARAENPWVAAILESALIRIFGRELAVVTVPGEGPTARYVVCSRPAREEVQNSVSHESFGETVSRLNGVEVNK